MSSNIRGRLSVMTTEDALGGNGGGIGPGDFSNTQFVRDEISITSTGVRYRGQDLTNTLDPNDLVIDPEPIGKGACSTVKKAYNKRSGMTVALKVINVSDPNHQKQLVQEVKSLFSTHCPAIVKFYGAFSKQDSVSIVLEYLDGGSLWNVKEQVGPIPERILANMAFQILWGLSFLKHERRIHRDIKPQNILINSQGQVKLTDFGISKELSTSVAMGRTFVGSFRYMAPERLQNQPHTYACDIWGLGIVLYEMATGHSPFSNHTQEEAEPIIDVVQSVVQEPSPQLPTFSPFGDPFSDSFHRFLAKCLAKDSRERPAPELLLLKPWLTENGATSLEDATANVRLWIQSLQ